MAYIFQKDGTCEWYYLSPVDDHHFRPGKWEFVGNNGQTLQIDKGATKATYRVLELSSDVLRLERLEDASKPE